MTTPPVRDAREEAKQARLVARWLTPSGNQVNAVVANAVTTQAVTFVRAERDTNYGVLVTPSWNTTYWVTAANKTVTGCTVNFGTASGATDTLDLATFRAPD